MSKQDHRPVAVSERAGAYGFVPYAIQHDRPRSFSAGRLPPLLVSYEQR
ncbi:hypothetical protein ACFV4T_40115 [Streptomyces sp. NPDC059755]